MMMNDQNRLTQPSDLKEPRIPWIIVADASSSMVEREAELRRVIGEIRQGVLEDAYLREQVDMSLITAAGTPCVVQPFVQAERFAMPEQLEFAGMSPMYGALHMALETLQAYKKACCASDVSVRQPILWVLTDGDATDEDDGICAELGKLKEARELILLYVHVGDDYDRARMPGLSRLSIQSADMDFVRLIRQLYKAPAYPSDWQD